MDPNAWQAYQAYTNRFNSGAREEHNPYTSNTASIFLAHQQLREAASQHYQNQIFPPSLVHAAANNKSHLHQQALANLNMSSAAGILSPPVTPWKVNSHDGGVGSSSSSGIPSSVIRDDHAVIQPPRRSVIETKTGQPAFPGQPPPLQDARMGREQQPAFPGQPPPRQSSQPRPSVHSQPAFPGIAPPHSPQYGNSYSPQAPSPQNYHCNSPQDYQREREKERHEQERRIREEERREQERIRREQERLRIEQEHKRREQERIRQEQERMRKEQEERRKREEYERRKREEQERRKREEIERQRKEQQERARQIEQERLREQERIQQERIRQEQERIRKEQERIKQEQEQIEQLKMEEQQRDLGLARLGALGALHDLGDNQDMISYNDQVEQHHNSFQHLHNFHELNMLNSNRQMIKEEKPMVSSHYNAWLNRANELLDLSSSDSRDTQQQQEDNSSQQQQQQQQGFIPQILMNPWDPQQPPVMTLAPIANAMQQYQQQWLTQYQQAAAMNNMAEESFPLGKSRVLCIPPDDDMGFLINLPAPCNLLYQPSPTDGVVRKNVDSPFNITFHKFLKDPDSLKREGLIEAPEKPPTPLPNQYSSSTPEPTAPTFAKKLYIPPYTPKAVKKDGDPENVKVSASGFSRSIVQDNMKKFSQSTPSRISQSPRVSQSRETNNGGLRPHPGSFKKGKGKGRQDAEDEDDLGPELPMRRESSRRKAKEQSKAKRQAQDSLLLDEDDPTLNNPALDLEDSDVDDEWTPMKEKDNITGRRKRDSSDDEDFKQFEDFNKKHNNKKRSYPEAEKLSNKRPSTDPSVVQNSAIVPDNEDVKVGDFMILKTDLGDICAPIWRIDGKTLIQKYECQDDLGVEYKNVNTYSGWTQGTRHKYDPVSVRVIRHSAKEIVVERLKPGDPATKGRNNHLDNTASRTPGARANSTATSTASPSKPVVIEELKICSRTETGQFQENFEVYMQTLISQCLDANFLNEIFSEQDEYFVSNIEKVDSVTLLRKDKLLTGVSWTLRFQQSLTVWPCLNDLGSEACTSTVCGACEKNKATTMLQMFGQPYHPNTLCTVPPPTEAMMNRNFSVCGGCARLCKLYHKLHHQKHTLFVMCSNIVERRKTEVPGIDTTQILNQLLADDAWLEQQFNVMQDLWADADSFEK